MVRTNKLPFKKSARSTKLNLFSIDIKNSVNKKSGEEQHKGA